PEAGETSSRLSRKSGAQRRGSSVRHARHAGVQVTGKLTNGGTLAGGLNRVLLGEDLLADTDEAAASVRDGQGHALFLGPVRDDDLDRVLTVAFVGFDHGPLLVVVL